MATSETVCKFNQSGFCKFQSHCRKQHVMKICTNTQCSMVTCIYRHPRVCRYFDNFGRCKFADSCAYLHKRNGNLCDIRKNQDKEIEELRKEVEELSKQVHDLRNILHEISNSPNQANTRTSTSDFPANLVKPVLTSTCSSITMIQSKHSSNSQANLGPVIPQLDGSQNTPQFPSDKSLQCETCHEIFATEEEFNYHDDAHQFCCDECFICYKTQVIADLHELEYHPNTHYADTYIPQSTKLLFANGQPS